MRTSARRCESTKIIRIFDAESHPGSMLSPLPRYCETSREPHPLKATRVFLGLPSPLDLVRAQLTVTTQALALAMARWVGGGGAPSSYYRYYHSSSSSDHINPIKKYIPGMYVYYIKLGPYTSFTELQECGCSLCSINGTTLNGCNKTTAPLDCEIDGL